MGFTSICFELIKYLKNEGYQIIATTPHNSDINLNDLKTKNNKIALLLGSEISGLSEEALDLADIKMKINMYGFTESLNISVSAAICCQYLSNQLNQNAILIYFYLIIRSMKKYSNWP